MSSSSSGYISPRGSLAFPKDVGGAVGNWDVPLIALHRFNFIFFCDFFTSCLLSLSVSDEIISESVSSKPYLMTLVLLRLPPWSVDIDPDAM